MRKEHLRTCVEKKGRSESKSDVTCVEAVEAAAEAEDGGVNGGGAAAVAAPLLLRPRTAALKAAWR